MDISSVSELIGTVGFPILVALLLMWYIKQEQDAMKETLNELKSAITRLIERIDQLGDSHGKN